MIIIDDKGNELLDIISVAEKNAEEQYKPINHCLSVVKVGDDYLICT